MTAVATMAIILSALAGFESTAVAQPEDPWEATPEELRMGCNSLEGYACYELGNLYYDGKGVTKDLAEARKLFEKACQEDYGPGCTNLGYSMETGEGGPKDQAAARTNYEKACKLGDGWGCTNLGVLWDEGRGGSQDRLTARTY